MTYEPKEWVNLWWERAGDASLPRMLLIGDSITVGYRPGVQALLEGSAWVDQLAASCAADDPALICQMDFMLGLHRYAAVHFNNGLHGSHLSDDEYRAACAGLLKRLTAACPRVVVALSTPVTLQGRPDTLDGAVDAQVRRRNAALAALARAGNLTVNDLYAPMAGRPGLRKADGYHNNARGRAIEARQVARLLADSLKGPR